MKIGIIGVGMVGGAIKRAYQRYDPICLDPAKGFKDNVYASDCIFICVPTPTDRNKHQNASALIDVLLDLDRNNYAGVCIIKSTILPGTTKTLAKGFPNLTLCHNPEFLTARNAYNDFISQPMSVIGHPYIDNSPKLKSITTIVEAIYHLIKIPVTFIGSNESEMAKYMHNIFLATKVIMMNEFNDACRANNINYDTAISAAITQGKIGNSHTVIAQDGKPGYSGYCFPKDVTAFLKKYNDCNIELLKKQWVVNKKLRGKDDQFINTFW